MRKILAIFIYLLCFTVFANNALQQQDEHNFYLDNKNMFNSEHSIGFLIKEDYFGYQNNKNAYYGYIVNGIKDLSKSNSENDIINVKYLTFIKQNIDNYINKDTSMEYLYIDDSEYKKLFKETKNYIMMYNTVFSKASI